MDPFDPRLTASRLDCSSSSTVEIDNDDTEVGYNLMHRVQHRMISVVNFFVFWGLLFLARLYKVQVELL